MDSIRRLGALVMGILVLQLSLVAGSSPCAETATVAETGHSGMSMPAESESCQGGTTGNGCAPWSHSACQAMTSCVAAVFQPAMQAQLSIAVAHAVAPTDPATLLQNRNTVPDLPPPRA
jgi:hypothetical protein